MSVNFPIFNLHFSADISHEMLKPGRVTKVKVLFLVLVFVFNFDLFKFSAAILEKGLFQDYISALSFLLNLSCEEKVNERVFMQFI